MLRTLAFCALLALSFANFAAADTVTGSYLETRTCDVYTGPCFANSQVGLTGNQAILAWSIEQGEFRGVDLTGMKVVMTVRAADTLGFALVEFARERAGRVAGEVVRVASAPIEMTTDQVDMVATLHAGTEITVTTRKLTKTDCVCSNEKTFYPPLTKVENSEPAYTVDASFQGRGLGSRWSAPGARSAFLATF